MKVREAKKPIMRKIAFSLIGIFVAGLIIRIVLFFMGLTPPRLISHIINYTVIAAILTYSGMQVYYKIKKHKFL